VHFAGFDNQPMAAVPDPPLQRWDLFCHVVDNHGDLGVCWRLARQLAARGRAVRLFVDDASALAWMAPLGAAGVQVHGWAAATAPGVQPGDVVVEGFGCALPAAFVAAMNLRQPSPVWVNLEYLSAEDYVERSHGLASPRPGGLTTWFFYPGFTPRTGGLLREPGLMAAQAGFDGDGWLAARGWARQPGERVVSLFCYDNPAAPALLQRLAEQPTLLLLTPGHAQRLAAAAMPLPGALRTVQLPWLPQDDHDHLLRACDVNFVRGEDSLVRALWAGRPCVWHIYPQSDNAHAVKLQAYLQRCQAPADVTALFWAWNGLHPAGEFPAWPDMARWALACEAWRSSLAAQPDLLSQLLVFVQGRALGKALPRC
jgi:uncharacterized repeat protein (TIGR03837 family)